MNIKMRLISLILILICPTWAVAGKFDPEITLADISPVRVRISDGATGGCWTNIKETKNYAEDQIQITGGKTVETNQLAVSDMRIMVTAERLKYGVCYGSITVTLEQATIKDGYRVIILFSEVSHVATGFDNLNIIALDQIKRAVDEWR